MDNDEIKYINLIDHTAFGEDDLSSYTIQLPSDLVNDDDNVFTMNHEVSGKMVINGSDADIEINGVSITQTLSGIQERLAILQPNPELEKEFLELAKIREQYIKLEKILLEKKAVWDALGRDD